MSEPRVVTLVCTGNLCRSPMAHGLLGKHLAELGVVDVDLRSAGTHAVDGSPATDAARAAALHRGADISAHRATFLDGYLARHSSLVLLASERHRRYLLEDWPDLDPARLQLFNDAVPGAEGVDVDDPYGLDASVYELVAEVIDRAMAAWAQRLADGWEPEGLRRDDRG